MLICILFGVAAVLALFIAVAATRPSAYRVERMLEVAAPAQVVFEVLNDLRQFAGIWVLFGAPFESADPDMQKTIEGPAAGVGQSCAWRGKGVGQGTLKIEQSVPGERIGVQLQFVKPMASKATLALTLAGAPGGSVVTWSMDGNHNFIGKAFGLVVNMDKALGADIEKALARLKTVAEGKAKT
jgi:hypothetical protein